VEVTVVVPAPILGQVGDVNFYVIFVIDPARPEEHREAALLNARLIERALATGCTCTGEYGVGLGKQDRLVAELGDAVESMRIIKRALHPKSHLIQASAQASTSFLPEP
jgi:D-lactate dehydrogenase (cytochrome)